MPIEYEKAGPGHSVYQGEKISKNEVQILIFIQEGKERRRHCDDQ